MLRRACWATANGQTWTLASYDMIASNSLILFVEQNSRLNEDEGYGAQQAVNIDLWPACIKTDTCGYGSVVNRENRFL